jgi:hypothetical protein
MENDYVNQEPAENGKRELISYPYFNLSAALKIGAAVAESGGANLPISKSVLTAHLKESEKSAVLQQRIASARCFGIIDGRNSFTLSDAGRRYYLPTSDTDKSFALLEFLATPPAFAEIIKRFDGTKLPSREILSNLIHREGRVPASWKDRIAAYFSSSAALAGALDAAGFLRFRALKERGLQKSTPEVSVASVEPNRTVASGQTTEIKRDFDVPTHIDSNVWDFSFGGKTVRLVTPTELDKSLWEKLNAYVQLLKPMGETQQ